MKVRVWQMALPMVALCSASAVLAGEEPLYKPAPNWVETVDLDTLDRDPANSLLVNDTQLRLVEGQLWEYKDIVYKIASLADLSNVGTLKAQWLPDKGDLIVHSIMILRDGETIDLVEQGEEMEVLRRERQLERRILDGSLTATMAVPGLQVGDELRLSYSVTSSDQALGREVQSQSFLWRKPGNRSTRMNSSRMADFARIRASWPESLDVQYKAGPNFELPEIEQTDGYQWLDVMMPLDEADEFPRDAPLRYRRGTLLQIGTFAGWDDVSSVMAPYYDTSGALDGIDDLLSRVEDIRTGYGTDLERAVAALELVQEDVRYLLNGLDGGNYLPQDVATTWEKKYGDCKAKTVILLAILEQLGIEAEAVLVSSRAGNMVPVSLPVPGAFDHVLVRATLGDNLYYLDGTSLGANIATVGNVPSFEYALPIRASGADIEPIEQLLPRAPDVMTEMIVDASAGADVPTITTIRAKMVGPRAAQFNAVADKITEERKRQMARGMNESMAMLEFEIIPGGDDSEATLFISGITPAVFEFDGTRGEAELGALASGMQFSPDRSRREWRGIPVSAGSARKAGMTTSVKLPEGFGDYELRDAGPVDVEIAGKRYVRTIDLDGAQLASLETVTTKGGEIAPEDFRAERRKAASLARQKPVLIAPEDVPRIWRYAGASDRGALAALEAAYAQLIANKPDEMDPYLNRAAFRYDTFDFAGSLEDMNKVVELEPDAEYFGQRATVHEVLGNSAEEIADLEEAYALDPVPSRAIDLASSLAMQGELIEAREILEYEDGNESVREELGVSLAEIDAMEGNAADGLARITELLDENPNNGYLLNEKCWFMGTWQVDIEDGITVCTKAVENSRNTSNAIDSRALIYLRNGMLDEALADVDGALNLNPAQTGSVMLRGLIRLEQGDKAGQADVDDALARDPSLKARFALWGFDV